MGSKGKACEIGIFDSEEEAALRYDQVAISLGKTILNFDRSARPWLGPIF